jgi:hypothetical protein
LLGHFSYPLVREAGFSWRLFHLCLLSIFKSISCGKQSESPWKEMLCHFLIPKVPRQTPFSLPFKIY